jgi:predicted glycoside hydrolase/deacetylase ChbG (UPF0249 family)
MGPNPILKKLGFSDDDRVVIIHTDDIGMCQASVSAFADLWDFGLISSGAVMVPCPWFLEAAAYARGHPGVDLGIHTTLTSEWSTYRWPPVSTRDPASGLVDDEGYFFRTSEQAREHASPEAVERELAAQVTMAKKAGIQPTHMDTHMGTVAHARFMPAYVQTALSNRLPALILRLDEAGWREMGLDGQSAAMAVQALQQLEETGFPLLDHLGGLELDDPAERLEQAKRALSSLKPGVTHWIIHPSKDTPELRAIASDWRCRVADYQTFLSDELRAHIRDIGVQVIGYRAIQQLIPA